MKWGIHFRISSDFDADLWGLPPPSSKRWITGSKGKVLEVLYHFQYAPQSWKEWQRVASIKVQIQSLITNLEFEEYGAKEIVESCYTISEIGKYFTGFIKFHKPLYPFGKNEFMRSLTIYAHRLHYENMWSYEALMAMGLHFNASCGLGYSYKDVMRKAKSISKLDRSDWNIKLSKEELQIAHKRGADKTAQIKRDKTREKRELVYRLREDGATILSISEQLSVSSSTVKRWLKQ